MLTLGVPARRDPDVLFTGLLVAADDEPPAHPYIGPRCVPLGSHEPGSLGGLVVRLDAEPSGPLDARAALVHVDTEHLSDALALDVGCPLVVFCADGDVVQTTSLIDDAGHHGGLDAAEVHDRLADRLAVLAHAHRGFFAVALDADAVLSVVAGTVAALRGDDIRRALRSPDLLSLASLHPDAAAATREVLLGVVVPDAGSVAEHLSVRMSEIRSGAAPTA